jgi:hypothetical protein
MFGRHLFLDPGLRLASGDPRVLDPQVDLTPRHQGLYEAPDPRDQHQRPGVKHGVSAVNGHEWGRRSEAEQPKAQVPETLGLDRRLDPANAAEHWHGGPQQPKAGALAKPFHDRQAAATSDVCRPGPKGSGRIFQA